MSYSVIAKEQIPFCFLSKEDVLENDHQRKRRKDQLQKAAHHNRLFHTRAKIIFDTIDETKEVNANIWEVTDNHVMLKGGINIPVNCVREVILESERRT